MTKDSTISALDSQVPYRTVALTTGGIQAGAVSRMGE